MSIDAGAPVLHPLAEPGAPALIDLAPSAGAGS
jgi:hypothetical protein